VGACESRSQLSIDDKKPNRIAYAERRRRERPYIEAKVVRTIDYDVAED